MDELGIKQVLKAVSGVYEKIEEVNKRVEFIESVLGGVVQDVSEIKSTLKLTTIGESFEDRGK